MGAFETSSALDATIGAYEYAPNTPPVSLDASASTRFVLVDRHTGRLARKGTTPARQRSMFGADDDILHAIEHALAVEDLAEDPDRWLVLGPAGVDRLR